MALLNAHASEITTYIHLGDRPDIRRMWYYSRGVRTCLLLGGGGGGGGQVSVHIM